MSKIREFTFKTKQGYKVMYRIQFECRVFVIAHRETDDTYIICKGYDYDSGTWAQGEYDYKTLEKAMKALFKYLGE